MKTLLKIFFVCALLAPALEANAQDVNTRTRQLRFYPVRAASDTAAIAGNSGRMWYDFSSNQFRGNVNGTNFSFGSGGASSYTFTDGLVNSSGTVGFGGSFTQNISIEGGSNAFSLGTFGSPLGNFSIYAGGDYTIYPSGDFSISRSDGTFRFFDGKGTFFSNNTYAPLRITPRTTPTTLEDGDLWVETSSIFARINGTTVDLTAGGSFTNGAANNELIKSNGTNGVSSGIFAEVLAGGLTTTFGTGSTAGLFRDFVAAGSEANIAIRFTPKGSGNLILQSATQITNSAPTSIFTSGISTISILASGREIRFAKTGTAAQSLISGADGISTDVNADSLVIEAGTAYTVSGNGNGGDLILKPGAGNGTGVDGTVKVKTPSGASVDISGLLEPDNETGTTFTLTEAHRAKGVYTSNGSDVTVTVPADLATGYQLTMLQEGAGTITLSAGANVNLTGKLSTTGPNDIIVVWLYKKDGGTSYYQCIGGAAPTVDMVTLVGGGSQNVTLTSQAASEQFLINSNRNIFLVDLTGRDSIMFSGRVITGGHTTAVLRLEYFTSFSTTVTDYLPIGSSSTAVEISMATSNTLPDSGWIPITSGAKGLRYLAIIQEGGNGTASPVVASLTMLLK